MENGLVMKSDAPSRMASTARSTVPCAVMITTVVSGCSALIRLSRSIPPELGHDEIAQHGVVQMLFEEGGALDAVLGHIDRPTLFPQGIRHGDPEQGLVLDDEQTVAADLHWMSLPGRLIGGQRELHPENRPDPECRS